MKYINKFLIPLMLIAITIAFIELEKSNKNIYIILIAFFVFMYGMMKLSKKTPSKNSENQNDNV